MTTKILLSRSLIALFFLLLASSAFAQTKSLFDIEYPIASLDNCADRVACKTYCADESHRNACEAFAHEYGISKKPTLQTADKFAVVKTDGGPDGVCGYADNPQAACGAVCHEQKNIEICVAYGEKHNLYPEKELVEAKKVRDALRAGIPLPAGCENADSCKTTCENPPTLAIAKQCFTFAKRAGLLPPDVDHARAEKAFQAIESGKTPFKSIKDFQKCEQPENETILHACISFGIENGLIPEKEADLLRKTGGRGPGGCFGRACETYCNDPTHQDECFRFAEEYNLISPEEKVRMQEGVAKFKEGVNYAPPEVQTCLKETIGGEVLEGVLAGNKMPSRDVGEKMKACFESFFTARDAARGGQKELPADIANCITRKFGPAFLENLKQNGPTPEMNVQMRVCFGKQDTRPEHDTNTLQKDERMMYPQMMQEKNQSAPCSSPEECKKMFNQMPHPLPLSPSMHPEEYKNMQKMMPFAPNEAMMPFNGEMQKQFDGQFPQEQPVFPAPIGTSEYKDKNFPNGIPTYPSNFPQQAPYPSLDPAGAIPPMNNLEQYKPEHGIPYPTGTPYPNNLQDNYGLPPGSTMPSSGDMPSGAPPPSTDFKPQSKINPPSLLGFFLQIFGAH